MSTKKIGYALTVFGAVAILVSLVVDTIGLGDGRIGASQLLGIQVGLFTALFGISLVLFYPDRRIGLRESMINGFERLLNLPVGFWVIAGFFVVYFLLFLTPVFLNAERSMWYFNRYLPDRRPIGLDIRAVMEYIDGWLASDKSPYRDGFIAYPPLALILFSPLSLIGYPAYYYLITIASLLFHTASGLLMPLFISKNQNNSLPLLLFFLSLFSYGFQFEIERGQSNIIAFSLCLIAVYLFHLHHKHRFPAYLLFTIGVQLKIYPAILIIMFVKDWRDWKVNFKRIAGILLLNLGLLFVFGFQIFSDFLHSVTGQQLYEGSWNGNHSLKGYVYQFVSDGFGLFQLDTLNSLKQYQGLIEISLFAIFFLCLFSIVANSYARRESGLNPNLLLACTIGALVIPSISNDYKLPILTAPMSIVLCALAMPEDRLKKAGSILLILILSMAYWSTQYPFVVKPYVLTRNFPALFIILITITVLNFVTSGKRVSEIVDKVNGQP